MSELYTYSFESNSGEEIALKQFKDKVLLIVNTASKCGFTPQYEGLEQLHKKYNESGLVILGFPCDQFGHQEPGSDSEISEFCKLNYGVTFLLSKKIDVNGPDAHPIYKYLKTAEPGIFGSEAIKWNFTKFLVNKKGEIVERYAPITKPDAISAEIERLLDEKTA